MRDELVTDVPVGGHRTDSSPGAESPPAPPSTYCLVLLPEEADAQALALAGYEPPEELHLTLLYLGKDPLQPPDLYARLLETLPALAESMPPMDIPVSGWGRFTQTVRDVVVALVSAPELDAARRAVESHTLGLGWTFAPDAHGFIPHLTLAAGPAGFDPGLPHLPATVRFSALALWAGARRSVYGLGRLARTPASGDTTPMTDAAPSATPDPRKVVTVHVDVTSLLSGTQAPEPVTPARPAELPVTARVVSFDAGQQATAEMVDPADWNRAHAFGRLRSWASSDGSGDRATVDAEKLSAAFAWYDPERASAGVMSAFRLPHHDIRDGKLVVSRAGLMASARSYMAGDLGIPDEDMGLVRLHLERHFAALKVDPPWYTAPGATEMRVVEGPVTMDARAEAPGTIPGVVSTTWIQVAKVGTFRGHPMGPFSFTPEVFSTIIANFRATANRMVPVDYEHATEALGDSVFQDGAPAVGWIVDLDNRGADGLWGKVEWIDPTAVDHVRQGRYRYFSPAVSFNAVSRETGKGQGPTLVSGGLTNRPFLDGMAPVTARDGDIPMGMSAADAVTGIAAPDTTTVVSTTPANPVAEPAAVPVPVAASVAPPVVTPESAPPTPEPTVATAPAAGLQAPEAAPVVPPADAPLPAVETPTARVRLRAELDAAFARAPEAGLRTLSWYEGMEDREDVLDMLRCVMGLPKLATEAEVGVMVDRLAAYVEGDMGERDGVDVRGLIRQLRSILALPALASAEAVVAQLLAALGPSETAPMSIGPSDVHIPSAAHEPPKDTTDMSLSAIATALKLSATATEADVLAAIADRDAKITTLSDRTAAHDRKDAESEVDALIGLGRLDKDGRSGAVTLRLAQPEVFAQAFPVRASAPPAAVQTPAAPTAGAQAQGAHRPEMAATMSQSVVPGGGAMPPAGTQAPAATPPTPPAPGRVNADYTNRVYARAVELRAKDGTLSIRAAMGAAEDEFAAARRIAAAGGQG